MHLHFNKEIDLVSLEDVLKLKATKLTPLSESKGENKCAKFYYQTNEYSKTYSDEEFEKFLFSLKGNLEYLPEILTEYDGECSFALVFTEVNDSPCISLSQEAIKFLNYLSARFDVDFI